MPEFDGLQHQAHSALPQCCHFTILHSVQSNSTFRTTESAITDIIFILIIISTSLSPVFLFCCHFWPPPPQLLYNRINFFIPKKIIFENPTFRFLHHFLFIFYRLQFLTLILFVPAAAVGFLRRKNLQHAFLRRGSKAVCPMSYICDM